MAHNSEDETNVQTPGVRLRCRAPAAERNTAPICEVLRAQLPATGCALEVASGTGQHVAAFARAFPDIIWQPSDPDAAARESITAWVETTSADNLMPPLNLDVSRARWHDEVGGPFDAILAINLLHIAPWAVAEGLLRGAAALLGAEGMLYLYGPYRRGGTHTAESNARFDDWLTAQDPQWGVRDMDDVESEGAKYGLRLTDVVDMLANNFSLILRKT